MQKSNDTMFFKNWAVVGFNDDTGIGRMATDIKEVLGVGTHLVINSDRLQNNALEGEKDFLIDENLSETKVSERLKGLEGIISIERPSWHPLLTSIIKKLKIPYLCVPMWEWFRGTDKIWDMVDLLICPNEKAHSVVRSYGFKNSVILPWCLDLEKLPSRQISGSARIFVHNVGLVDHDDRKATHAVIKSFKKLPYQDAQLLLRSQKSLDFPIDDERISLSVGNRPLKELYAEGDVFIQPSKMEGLGFMVLEPVCCGCPVITVNEKPMNEYVQTKELLVKKKWFKKKSFAYNAAKIKHAYLKEPSISDLTKKMSWCYLHDMSDISISNLEFGLRVFNKEKLYREWRDLICSFLLKP
jgi:glycosyltransferase involved in cell wall biosynthesis